MRGTLAGALSGALGLLVLHAFVARANQDQLQGIVSVAVGVVDRFLNPATPAISDHSSGASSSSSSSARQPTVPTSTLKIAPIPVPNLWNSPAAATPASTYPAPTSR